MKRPMKKAVRKRPSVTALALRTVNRALGRKPAPEVLPAIPVAPLERSIADGINIGNLGLVEIHYTEAEEKILSEPVPVERVLWKPQRKGPPLPYLPHQDYTRWFIRAFGRGGWQIVPISRAALVPFSKHSIDPETGEERGTDGASLVRTYVLYIHGQPAAFAEGEQEYFESNRQQTYGDALESTIGIALRRCAKRIGVGLELWDKTWIEQARRARNRGGQPERPEPVHGHDSLADEPITKAQQQRLWVIARRARRTDAELGVWLPAVYGITSTKAIKRRDYDRICRALEQPGPLPMPEETPAAREPGEDG